MNVIRYLPGATPKSLALAGRPRDLFPPPEFVRAELVRRADGSRRPLIESATVYVVEGEPDAIAACSLGVIAVAIPGANGWRSEWASRFAGMIVRVLTDHDSPGHRLAEEVAADLTGITRRLQVLAWPDVVGHEPSPGFDWCDYAVADSSAGIATAP